ncbi:MAG TPA: hypothetical protein VMV81_14380 [Phycisphaerae bacterium]|nr:hypothetical protein [Phycisphaerae bacterium]
MSIDLNRIESRLRERLCPVCVRCTMKHTCSLPPDRSCALFEQLPLIVDIVRKTREATIDPYVQAVRGQICSVCRFEDVDGACSMREDIDCALNTYLPIIIDEIEQELDRVRHERGAAHG